MLFRGKQGDGVSAARLTDFSDVRKHDDVLSLKGHKGCKRRSKEREGSLAPTWARNVEHVCNVFSGSILQDIARKYYCLQIEQFNVRRTDSPVFVISDNGMENKTWAVVTS